MTEINYTAGTVEAPPVVSIVEKIKPRVFDLVCKGKSLRIQIKQVLEGVDMSHINTALEQLEQECKIERKEEGIHTYFYPSDFDSRTANISTTVENPYRNYQITNGKKNTGRKSLVTVEALEEAAFEGLDYDQAAVRFCIGRRSFETGYLYNRKRPEFKAAWLRGLDRRAKLAKVQNEIELYTMTGEFSEKCDEILAEITEVAR